jgi:hypothetical protein
VQIDDHLRSYNTKCNFTVLLLPRALAARILSHPLVAQRHRCHGHQLNYGACRVLRHEGRVEDAPGVRQRGRQIHGAVCLGRQRRGGSPCYPQTNFLTIKRIKWQWDMWLRVQIFHTRSLVRCLLEYQFFALIFFRCTLWQLGSRWPNLTRGLKLTDEVTLFMPH